MGVARIRAATERSFVGLARRGLRGALSRSPFAYTPAATDMDNFVKIFTCSLKFARHVMNFSKILFFESLNILVIRKKVDSLSSGLEAGHLMMEEH